MKISKQLLRHFFIWMIYVIVNHTIRIVEYHGDLKRVLVSDTIVKYGLAIGIFYLSLFLFNRFWQKNKLLFLVLIAIIPIINGILRYLLYAHVLPFFETKYAYPYSIMQSSIIGLWWWFQYSVFALGYWYYGKSIKSERMLRVSETQRLQLENQKLQLQYDYLQAQINPHFLYNTIAFFHSKAMEFSKETATGMELLAAIMRYSLQPSTGDAKVPLRDEVTHLCNYIELHQLRYENGLNIEFTQSGNYDNIRIPPHVLITLVENAFKHGIFSDNHPPLKIDLKVVSGNLHFNVTNKINPSRRRNPEPGSGIGLSNIKSRLEKEYGEKFRLQYDAKNETFTVSLDIYAS